MLTAITIARYEIPCVFSAAHRKFPDRYEICLRHVRLDVINFVNVRPGNALRTVYASGYLYRLVERCWNKWVRERRVNLYYLFDRL